MAVFQQRNPRAWEHLRERVGMLRGWRWQDVADLEVGWALLGAALTTSPRWQRGARRFRVRPLLCEHGGHTRAMV